MRAVALLAALFVATLLTGSSAAVAAEWYEGGTLHQATIGAWKSANYSNRLATAADFAAKLLHPISTPALRAKASELEACISEAGADSTSDSMQVTQVAAACAVLLGYTQK